MPSTSLRRCARLVSAFDALVRPKLLPPEPAFYRLTFLYVSLFASIVALNLVASRFWCRYLCPLGGLLGILSKVGWVRREVNARCNQCQACARICPTGTITAADNFRSDPGECTMCLECYYACPQGAVEFPTHLSLAARRGYDPSRRQAVLAVGTAVAGVSLFAQRHPLPARPSAPDPPTWGAREQPPVQMRPLWRMQPRLPDQRHPARGHRSWPGGAVDTRSGAQSRLL